MPCSSWGGAFMTLSPKSLRDLRRWLRSASDNCEDAADLIGSADKQQQKRLRELTRNLEAEIAEIDRKISKAETGRE
jgi:hypothetical protein